MLKQALTLKTARVLLVNDDGIDAPGIEVLANIVRPLVGQMIVVAPEHEQSGCGHTVAIARPLRIMERGPGRYAINGTPPDCVLIGANEIMKEAKPDLVLSGINKGRNVAEDVHYSGTLAACYEAGIMGLPAIAFSQHILPGEPVSFEAAQGWLASVLQKLIAAPWPGECLMNVNFPARPAVQIREVAVTRLGRISQGYDFQKGVDPRGQPYYWNSWRGDIIDAVDAAPDTDFAALMGGAVSVTPIKIDQTEHAALDAVRRMING